MTYLFVVCASNLDHGGNSPGDVLMLRSGAVVHPYYPRFSCKEILFSYVELFYSYALIVVRTVYCEELPRDENRRHDQSMLQE